VKGDRRRHAGGERTAVKCDEEDLNRTGEECTGDVLVPGEWVTDDNILVLDGLIGMDSAVTLDAVRPTEPACCST